jgi:ubiquinone biosynthesis protein UbiJ
MTGDTPGIEVHGDAALATDIHWLFDNLRWDIDDDLSRIVGPVPARELARLAASVAAAVRGAARSLSAVAARARSERDDSARPGAQ